MNTIKTEKHKYGINNYDNKMLEKVKSWFSNTIYANTAITYNTIYNLMDSADNKLQVPLINIYRPNGFSLVPMQNFSAKKQGLSYIRNTQGFGARYITVNLMYQFDIYAKTIEDMNTMAETLIQTFNFFPTIEIVHEDRKTKEKFVEVYEIEYLSGPTDQSEFNNDDRVYRNYIQYEIKNAKIYDFTDYDKIKEIEAQLELEGELEIVEEIEISEKGD